MRLSNVTAMFHSGVSQNRSLHAGNPALFGPAEKGQTTLQKLSNQIIAGQEGSEQLEDLSKTAQIRKDSYIPKNSSNKNPLDDIPTGVLELYLDTLRLWLTTSEGYGHELSDFKEQLRGMDNTIQSYQDILDGKTPLREGRSMQEVRLSCDLAKVHRQQFYEYGMTHFSKTQIHTGSHFDEKNHDRAYEKMIHTLLGDCRFSKKNEADWGLDPYASDIYSEIDRISADLDGRTAEIKQGMGRLLGILYKRGHGYKGFWDAPADPQPSHIAQSVDAWKQKIEQLKAGLQVAEDNPLPSPVRIL